MTLENREALDEAKAKDAPPEKMRRKVYESELHKLQVRLCKLQDWVKEKGLRVVIVFEGRDAAGKGGTIKALTEKVSPRVFRVIALPAPPILLTPKGIEHVGPRAFGYDLDFVSVFA